MIHWAGEYIGIPYEPRGRTREGIDCWGIAMLVWREQFEIELPDFEYDADTARAFRDYAPTVNNVEVSVVVPGDIAMIRRRGRVRHVGIYVGEESILHIMGKSASIIERIDSYRLRSTIEEWRRPLL